MILPRMERVLEERYKNTVRMGVVLVMSLLGGCLGSNKEPARTASSTAQVAAVLVTPTMVARWSDVSGALSPNFTMSGDAAVGKVLPTTERVQTQVLDALGLSLAAGLPGSSTTKSNAVSSLTDAKGATDAAGTTTMTSTTDRSTNNTTTKSLTPGAAPAAPTAALAGGSLPAGLANTGGLDVDPVLQYKAANYLQQAVQLLNVEVQNAATRGCYVAFVTKLKIAVMPYRPNMGYDLHTRIGFFYHGDLPPPTEATQLPTSCRSTATLPVVVPLLAADDLQMASNAKAVAEAQQIGLALSAMVHGVGAAASFDKVNQRMQAILNNQLSSSLTISQESENTLYVRIAAGNSVSGQPALVGQTYDIATLLLVPKQLLKEIAPRIDVDAFTEMRRSTDGELLQREQNAEILQRADAIIDYFSGSNPEKLANWNKQDRLCIVNTLVQDVQSSNERKFLSDIAHPICSSFTLMKAEDAEALRHSIWLRFSALLADNTIKSSVLWLPTPARVGISPTGVQLVVDDGTQNSTVYISGVTGYVAGSLMAHLAVTQPAVKATKAAAATSSISYSIPASSMSYDPNVEVLGIVFPSVKKIGIKLGTDAASISLQPNACVDDANLCPDLNNGHGALALPAQFVTPTAATSSPAAITLSSLSPTIVVEKDATGEAEIKLSGLPAKETAIINVPGTAVKAVHDPSGAVVALGDKGYTLTTKGVYTFDFINLMNGASVVFSGQETKGTTALGTTSLAVPATSR